MPVAVLRDSQEEVQRYRAAPAANFESITAER
jgi:hypothetical protein